MATVDSRRGGDFDPLAPEVHQGLPARYGTGPGLVSGLVMLIVWLILSVGRGVGFGWPFKLLATTFRGPSAMQGGWGIVVFGFVAHFVLSVLLGMVFARVVGRTTRSRLLLMGMLYGIALWAAVQFLILPWTSPNVALRMGTVWPFFLAAFSYGLMLGSLLPAVVDIDARPQAYIDPLGREVRP